MIGVGRYKAWVHKEESKQARVRLRLQQAMTVTASQNPT